MKNYSYILLLLLILPAMRMQAQFPVESDYYRMTTVPVPENIALEVGGVTILPDGSVAVSVRRGDVWIIENPSIRHSNDGGLSLRRGWRVASDSLGRASPCGCVRTSGQPRPLARPDSCKDLGGATGHVDMIGCFVPM